MPWLPAAIGFLFGGLFIRGLDFVIPHIHRNAKDENQQQEGIDTSLSKMHYLFLRLHCIIYQKVYQLVLPLVA